MKKCFICTHESFTEPLLKCFTDDRVIKPGLVQTDASGKEKLSHLLCSMFFPELIFHATSEETYFTGVIKIKQDNYLEDCAKCNKTPNGNCMAKCSDR